jgi:NADPH:quinone reductase
MNTLAFNRIGSPEEVLQIIQKEKPLPGDKEVLVKMLAVPINPSDIYFIEGKYRLKPEFPDQTAGLEGAGIVEKAGGGVSIPEGALVSFFSGNTWAEYVLVPADELAVLPKDFPVEKAAQFSLNPYTAWGLLDMSGPAGGEWMLLDGANSTVARIVIQLASRKGVRIIAIIRDMTQVEELRTLGAEHVFHIEDEHLSDHIRQATESKGVNVALEFVGGSIVTKIIENLAPFARLIIYGLVKRDEPAQFFNSQVVYKNLRIQGFGVRAFLANQTKAQRTEMTQGLIEAMGQPSFQLPVAQAFPWREFSKALRQNNQSGRLGKIVLNFFPERESNAPGDRAS